MNIHYFHLILKSHSSFVSCPNNGFYIKKFALHLVFMSLPLSIQISPSVLCFHALDILEDDMPVLLQNIPRSEFGVCSGLDLGCASLAVFLSLRFMSGAQCLHQCPPHLNQVLYPTQSVSPPAINPLPAAQASPLCCGLPQLPSSPPYTSGFIAQAPRIGFWTKLLGTERKEGRGKGRRDKEDDEKEDEEESNTNFEAYYTSGFSVVPIN